MINVHIQSLPMLTKRVSAVAKCSDYSCHVHVYRDVAGEFPWVPKGTRKIREEKAELDKFRSEVPEDLAWMLRGTNAPYVLQGMKMIHEATRVYIFGNLQHNLKVWEISPLARVWHDFAQKEKKPVLFLDTDEGWFMAGKEKLYIAGTLSAFYGEKNWQDGDNIALLSSGYAHFDAACMKDMLLKESNYREVIASCY